MFSCWQTFLCGRIFFFFHVTPWNWFWGDVVSTLVCVKFGVFSFLRWKLKLVYYVSRGKHNDREKKVLLLLRLCPVFGILQFWHWLCEKGCCYQPCPLWLLQTQGETLDKTPQHCDQSIQMLPWEIRRQIFTEAPRAHFLPSVRRQGCWQPVSQLQSLALGQPLSALALCSLSCVRALSSIYPFLKKYVGWRWFHFLFFNCISFCMRKTIFCT